MKPLYWTHGTQKLTTYGGITKSAPTHRGGYRGGGFISWDPPTPYPNHKLVWGYIVGGIILSIHLNALIFIYILFLVTFWGGKTTHKLLWEEDLEIEVILF